MRLLGRLTDDFFWQRQTVMSQFYQLDRLVVEVGRSVRVPALSGKDGTTC